MAETEDKKLEALLDAFVGEQPDAGDTTASQQDEEKWDDESVSFLHAVDVACNTKYAGLFDADKAWEAFAARERKPRHARRLWIAGLTAAAAIVAAVVMMLWGGLQEDTVTAEAESVEAAQKEFVAKTNDHSLSQTEDVKTRTMVFKTGVQDIRTITLSDGTEVTLNARSELRYPERFTGGERRVTLKGEAYLKVAPDSRHPFVVQCGKISARVLGTEFNMRGYDWKEAHVTLVSGRVEVLAADKRVVMKPCQDVWLNGNELMVNDVNPKDFTSWRQGIFYYDNASLQDILQQIGNWYGVNVVCTEESLLNKHYHYMFHTTDSLEHVISLIRETSEVEISLRGNTIYVE
ncbi:MAG: FecR family protein [Prevotella sp.]